MFRKLIIDKIHIINYFIDFNIASIYGYLTH